MRAGIIAGSATAVVAVLLSLPLHAPQRHALQQRLRRRRRGCGGCDRGPALGRSARRPAPSPAIRRRRGRPLRRDRRGARRRRDTARAHGGVRAPARDLDLRGHRPAHTGARPDASARALARTGRARRRDRARDRARRRGRRTERHALAARACGGGRECAHADARAVARISGRRCRVALAISEPGRHRLERRGADHARSQQPRRRGWRHLRRRRGLRGPFTVNEQLSRLPLPNDAVVRTDALSGSIHLDGRPSVVEIDLRQLESDQPRRDQYIHNRMFRSDPIATLTFDELPALPQSYTPGGLFEGEIIGRLLILGAEHPLTFTVEARIDPGRAAGTRTHHIHVGPDQSSAPQRTHRGGAG